MKLHYEQHAKDHPFKVGHKVWIYNPAVKPSLSKKLCSLWHDPFHLVDQVTPVSFKVCNIQGKLQKGSVHVNQMKQYFSYDDPPINPPPKSNSPGNSPNLTSAPQNVFTRLPATEDTELVHDNLPETSRNIATDREDNLGETQPLPDLTELQKMNDIDNVDNQLDTITATLPDCVTTRNADNQLDINTLTNSVSNHAKRKAIHFVEKKTPANDYTLSDHVINSSEQSFAHSRGRNNFFNHLHQQKTTNIDLPTDIHETLANNSNTYLVEQVKKHRHQNVKLEFLIK